MRLRWLIGNFSDHDYPLTRREQWRVTWRAHHEHLSQRTLWITTAGLLIAAVVLFRIAHPPLQVVFSWTGLGHNGSWVASASVICVVVGLGSGWAYSFIYRRPVWRAMREGGYDVCLGCGYWLAGHGPDATACSECGRARDETGSPQAT
jgi:hypothetical protein